MIVLPQRMSEMKEANESFFIEMYDISLRTGTIHLCACDEDIIIDHIRYIAVPIQRETITKSMDNITDGCSLSISDVDYNLLAYLTNGYDFRGVHCSMWRMVYPDTVNDPSIREYMYIGRLDEFSFSDGVFSCKFDTTFPDVQLPRRKYQLYCNSSFGDDNCKADKQAIEETIVKVEGNYVTVSNKYNAKHWTHGVATVDGESRCIDENESNWIKVNINFAQDNLVGKKVLLERGCDKTIADCDKFLNRHNYSGFLSIPFESVYR